MFLNVNSPTALKNTSLQVNDICLCIFFFVDVDECAKDLDDCHSDAVCVNNIGSFFCVCDTGFKELKEGRLCVKEDEGKYM